MSPSIFIPLNGYIKSSAFSVGAGYLVSRITARISQAVFNVSLRRGNPLLLGRIIEMSPWAFQKWAIVESNDIEKYLKPLRQCLIARLPISLYENCLVPILEESVYRFWIQQGIEMFLEAHAIDEAIASPVAVVLASIIFARAHESFVHPQFDAAFLSGMVCGYSLSSKGGLIGLVEEISIHSTNNLSAENGLIIDNEEHQHTH